MGTRRGMYAGDELERAKQIIRASLVDTPEEFIDRHDLAEMVSFARDLAVRHYGDAFTGIRCILHAEGWDQYVEVEIGVCVPRDAFLQMRDEYLDAFEAAYPDNSWDILHLSVRFRASAE